MKRLGILALAMTMASAFVGSAQVQAASFGGLGMLPGPSAGSLANDVSDDGSTVVGVSYRLGASPRFEAFRWRAETGMVGLGMLNPTLRVPYSEAIAVSADGSVVVGQSTVEAGLLADQAFRWDATSGLAGLPEAGTSYAATQAYDVSGDGSVIVGGGSSICSTAEAFAGRHRWA